MKAGTSTGGIEQSPRYRRKRARARRVEEAGWEAQHGPVLIKIGEWEIYAKSPAPKEVQAARKLLLAAMSSAGTNGGVVGLDGSVRPLP